MGDNFKIDTKRYSLELEGYLQRTDSGEGKGASVSFSYPTLKDTLDGTIRLSPKITFSEAFLEETQQGGLNTFLLRERRTTVSLEPSLNGPYRIFSLSAGVSLGIATQKSQDTAVPINDSYLLGSLYAAVKLQPQHIGEHFAVGAQIFTGIDHYFRQNTAPGGKFENFRLGAGLTFSFGKLQMSRDEEKELLALSKKHVDYLRPIEIRRMDIVEKERLLTRLREYDQALRAVELANEELGTTMKNAATVVSQLITQFSDESKVVAEDAAILLTALTTLATSLSQQEARQNIEAVLKNIDSLNGFKGELFMSTTMSGPTQKLNDREALKKSIEGSLHDAWRDAKKAVELYNQQYPNNPIVFDLTEPLWW